MLDHPVFHDILINTYIRVVFHTFMLENGIYITHQLN